MKRRSKRMRAMATVDIGKIYPPAEAIELLKRFSTTNFVESIDVAISLGIDAKKSDQTVRGHVLLPHGTGKQVRVAVFAQGALQAVAKDAGADLVGMEDLATQIEQGQLNFDVVIAAPDTMRLVGTLGRILGPRGLMPNPRLGTVTLQIREAVLNAKSGQVRYRNDKYGYIHCTIGKINFTQEAIMENLEALLIALRRSKPATSKGLYIKKITLSTTMGLGLALDTAAFHILTKH